MADHHGTPRRQLNSDPETASNPTTWTFTPADPGGAHLDERLPATSGASDMPSANRRPRRASGRSRSQTFAPLSLTIVSVHGHPVTEGSARASWSARRWHRGPRSQSNRTRTTPSRSATGSPPAPFAFAARPAVIDHLSGCSHGADSVEDPSWPDSPAQIRRRTLESAVDRVRRRALLRPGLRGVGGVVPGRTPLGGVLLLALPPHRPEHHRRIPPAARRRPTSATAAGREDLPPVDPTAGAWRRPGHAATP